MQVVILCGGRGTRLREETEFKPKPLVEIGGMPILWHIMKIYSMYGVKDFILCLGYKGHMIKEFFMNLETHNQDIKFNTATKKTEHLTKYKPDDWNIIFAETGLDTNTGGRIKRIEKYVEGDDFFLTYGDGLSDVDINALYKFHKKHGKIGTVTAIRPIARFGTLEINKGMVVDFTKKSTAHGNRIDGGFFVFNRKLFNYLSSDKNCILEDRPLKKLVADNEFVAYKYDGFWQCMDIPQHADFLNQIWNSNEAPWKKW